MLLDASVVPSFSLPYRILLEGCTTIYILIQFGGVTNEANMDTCVHPFPGHSWSCIHKAPLAPSCHVAGSSGFVLFYLFAFAISLLLATGAQERKTLIALRRKSSE